MTTENIIRTIKKKCQEAPKRAPNYEEVLLDTVSDILLAENLHATQATNIQQKVTDYCESLGDFIFHNTITLNKNTDEEDDK